MEMGGQEGAFRRQEALRHATAEGLLPCFAVGPMDVVEPDPWAAIELAVDADGIVIGIEPATGGRAGKPPACLEESKLGNRAWCIPVVFGGTAAFDGKKVAVRSEEHTSELQSLMRI